MPITTETIPGYVAGTWNIDSAHSELTFSVRHLAISKVKGSFSTFDVTLVTGDAIVDSKVTATIDIASISTGNADRDGHLHSDDFFNTEAHPKAVFESTSITEKGDDLVIDGNLTLKGVTEPVQLVAEFGGITTDAYGQTKAGFSAKGKIDRTKFGVSFNASLDNGGVLLSNDIALDFEIQLVLAAA
ncbi:YceI family protein [Frondihabitans australicus]|uniref:Polyisoprenoid-binding protein YceI n=1 Tax=Frondihabitans australicus TaxID=386892 RepID=A0A495IH74_9MICO|nr:YceI family protein [Frondihabitans australicus]RKR74671.1 polyisoprenoid-binding protein YceI [Frondihabitans australicus]